MNVEAKLRHAEGRTIRWARGEAVSYRIPKPKLERVPESALVDGEAVCEICWGVFDFVADENICHKCTRTYGRRSSGEVLSERTIRRRKAWLRGIKKAPLCQGLFYCNLFVKTKPPVEAAFFSIFILGFGLL